MHNVISMASGGIPPLQFPTHNAPRVWLLTSGDSPIGVSLARKILDHGDYVVSGIIPADFERDGARSEEFQDFLAEVSMKAAAGWKERLRIVALDVRCASLCFAYPPRPLEAGPLCMNSQLIENCH